MTEAQRQREWLDRLKQIDSALDAMDRQKEEIRNRRGILIGEAREIEAALKESGMEPEEIAYETERPPR